MNSKAIELFQQTVPSIYPRAYLQIAAERGADILTLMQQAGLPQETQAEAPSGLSFQQLERLICLVVKTVGDQGIGMEVGWRLPPTAFGNFGYALLCCSNLREVMQLCQRFWHLNARGVNMTANVQNDLCVIDFVVPEMIREPFLHQIIETTIASIVRGYRLLLRDDQAPGTIWFSTPKPLYADKLEEVLGQCHYDMPADQFRFPTELLSRSLEMSNPVGLQFAVEQCEKENQRATLKSGQTLHQVQQSMNYGEDGFPDLEQLAAALNMTSRTLRRRLQQNGTRYKTLLEEARRRDAVRLLDNPQLPIYKIAALLGYQDPANFTRAFRQWTGHSPSQYREMRYLGDQKDSV